MVDLSPLVQYIIVSVFRSVLALFFVLIGFELKNLIQDDKHDLLLIIGSVAIWLSILLIRHNSVNMHTYGFESIGLFMITGTMGSYSILKISKLLKNSIFLRWAGENSLNIMALHYQPMPFMYLMSLATMPIKIVTIRLMISTLLIFITLFLLIKIWNAMQTGRLRGL